MGINNNKEKLIISDMLFYHRIYLNGKKVLLNDEILENLNQILDEVKPKNLEDLQRLSHETKNIRKILGKLIPDDSELLENTKSVDYDLNDLIQKYYNNFPIYNYFSPSQYKKINKEPSLFPFSDLKIIQKCENFNILEFEYSKDIEKEISSFFDENKENKNIEKDFYTILIIGLEKNNQIFINGFLNFLFDVNKDDNYRLVLESNYERTENIFSTKIINSKKGNFLFLCFNIIEKHEIKLEFKALIENFKIIEKEKINLILFNMYEAYLEPDIQINESEKNEIFFVCPSVSFNILNCCVLEKEFKFFEKFILIMKNQADEKLIKETILEMVKHDKLLSQKFTSCYLNYDCTYDTRKNQDIFFKYVITMEGYQYFYNIISNRKNKFINFSSLLKCLLMVEEGENLDKYFAAKKGDNWIEYHLYDIKIKNLKKENEEKEKEKIDLEKQNEENSNDFDIKIKKLADELDNLRFYKTNIQKDESMFLPISSEKIGIKLHEGNYTHVCQKCKCNCHIGCDEMIKKFCKCFKLTLFGFQCQVCPNKCYTDSHEVVYYQYPNYEYKKIGDILKIYYKDEYPRKDTDKSKIDYLIDLKEEEKLKLNKNYEIRKNTLDILINENNNIINSQMEAIEIIKDKKNKIYDANKEKFNNEKRKIKSYLEQFTNENLKSYEKLIISIYDGFNNPFVYYEGGGERCCQN